MDVHIRIFDLSIANKTNDVYTKLYDLPVIPRDEEYIRVTDRHEIRSLRLQVSRVEYFVEAPQVVVYCSANDSLGEPLGDEEKLLLKQLEFKHERQDVPPHLL